MDDYISVYSVSAWFGEDKRFDASILVNIFTVSSGLFQYFVRNA